MLESMEKCLMVLLGSVFHYNAFLMKTHIDLRTTSFVPTSLLFQLLFLPLSSFFNGSDLDMRIFFLCFMQTSSEAGYCVIRVSQNRYRIFALSFAFGLCRAWCYLILYFAPSDRKISKANWENFSLFFFLFSISNSAKN